MNKRTTYKSKLPQVIENENSKRRAVGLPPLEIKEIAEGAGVSRQTVYRWLKSDEKFISITDAAVKGFKKFFKIKKTSDLYEEINPEVAPV